MRKLTILLALGALAPFGLAACGGGGGGSTTPAAPSPTTTTAGGGGGGGGETVNVAASSSEGDLAFAQSSLSAKAGNDTFDFNNPQGTTHDFCIEDSSGAQLGCSSQISSSSTTLTVDLSPGKYTYYCSVDAHRDAGMQGTLTVK